MAAVLQGTMLESVNAGFGLIRDDADSIGIEAQITSFEEVAVAHPRFPIPDWLQICICV